MVLSREAKILVCSVWTSFLQWQLTGQLSRKTCFWQRVIWQCFWFPSHLRFAGFPLEYQICSPCGIPVYVPFLAVAFCLLQNELQTFRLMPGSLLPDSILCLGALQPGGRTASIIVTVCHLGSDCGLQGAARRPNGLPNYHQAGLIGLTYSWPVEGLGMRPQVTHAPWMIIIAAGKHYSVSMKLCRHGDCPGVWWASWYSSLLYPTCFVHVILEWQITSWLGWLMLFFAARSCCTNLGIVQAVLRCLVVEPKCWCMSRSSKEPSWLGAA